MSKKTAKVGLTALAFVVFLLWCYLAVRSEVLPNKEDKACADECGPYAHSVVELDGEDRCFCREEDWVLTAVDTKYHSKDDD